MSRPLCLALLLPAAVLGAELSREASELTLSQLMARMAGTSGVAVRFSERKQLALLERPLESRGTLYFAPPDRLARFTSEPGDSALIVDGSSVRYREADDAEELDLSSTPAARVFVDHFIVLFNGDLEELERRYAAEFSAAGEAWALELRPRARPLDRFLARITLRGDREGMKEMAVLELSGDSTVTRFEVLEIDRRFSPAELETLFSSGRPLPEDAGSP